MKGPRHNVNVNIKNLNSLTTAPTKPPSFINKEQIDGSFRTKCTSLQNWIVRQICQESLHRNVFGCLENIGKTPLLKKGKFQRAG